MVQTPGKSPYLREEGGTFFFSFWSKVARYVSCVIGSTINGDIIVIAVSWKRFVAGSLTGFKTVRPWWSPPTVTRPVVTEVKAWKREKGKLGDKKHSVAGRDRYQFVLLKRARR